MSENFTTNDKEYNNQQCIDQKIVDQEKMPAKPKISQRSVITVGVLVFINLLNYMDRFTIASVLIDIQNWFSISKTTAGLLQTVFVCAYLVFAPVFGYLGDRFSRKYVMAVGITIWAGTTLAGSFMGRDQFAGFFVFRGLVGIGEASYSTVAPTIIADLFVGNQRSIALTVFYFAIPCGSPPNKVCGGGLFLRRSLTTAKISAFGNGFWRWLLSGLGYIVGSKVAKAIGGWQWALRVTPGLGIIAVLLTLIVVHEPKRGVIEVDPNAAAIDDLSESVIVAEHTSYIDDLRSILNVPSFNWATAGFTALSFVVGALAFWAPEFAYYAEQSHDYNENRTLASVSYVFGIVTFVSGIIGVWLGAEIARRWRATNDQSDALVCAIGIMGAIPFLFFALYVADRNIIVCWVLIAIGEILMCMNWAPNGDLLLYVIPPNCRSTAEAIQIVFLHLLGDAFSPFVVGAISDAYTGKGGHISNKTKYLGLLYALYITPFICCFAGLCYFICARHIAKDKANADAEALRQLDIAPEASMNSLPITQSPLPDGPNNVLVSGVYDENSYESDDNFTDQDTDKLIPDRDPHKHIRV